MTSASRMVLSGMALSLPLWSDLGKNLFHQANILHLVFLICVIKAHILKS